MSFSNPYNPSHRRIASNYLLSNRELVRNPLIEIDAEGRIISIESCPEPDRESHTEFYAGLLFAGMINAHCHLELSYLKGQIAQGGGLTKFAQGVGSERDKFSDQEIIEAATATDLSMQMQGVAAVGDISNSSLCNSVRDYSSINYHIFNELFGLRRDEALPLPIPSDPKASFTPHSTYSVQDRLFCEIAHNGDAPLSIHFMESTAEAELYEGRGEMAEWYYRVGLHPNFLKYKSPAKRITACVPADRSIILVHNCHVTQREIDTIMEHFTAPVYWAICPRSNDYISRTKPPVELLRHNKLNICIGTDSLASNHSLSMLEEMRMIDAPLLERLDWATRVGAKALNISELGEVKVGCRPALNLLSGIDYEQWELLEQSTITNIIKPTKI